MAKSSPRPPADGDRMALILADAKLIGDKAAAEKHGIAERTIRRWRVAAKKDRPEVAEAVAANVREARQEAVASWQGVIDDTINEAVAYIRWAAKVPVVTEGMSVEELLRLRPSALMVQSLVSAVKVLHEIGKPDADANAAGAAKRTMLVIKKAAGPSKAEPVPAPAKTASKPKASK